MNNPWSFVKSFERKTFEQSSKETNTSIPKFVVEQPLPMLVTTIQQPPPEIILPAVEPVIEVVIPVEQPKQKRKKRRKR